MPEPMPIPNVYPKGHPPFIPGGGFHDAMTAAAIAREARQGDVVESLNTALVTLSFARHQLEVSRAALFQAEALIDTQALERPDVYAFVVHDMPAVLESLKAAARCVEEWMESKSRHAVLAKYPTRLRRK